MCSDRVYNRFFRLWLNQALGFQGIIRTRPTARRRVSAVRSLQQPAWWPGWGTQKANWASWRTSRWPLLFTKPTRVSKRAKRWEELLMMMLILFYQSMNEKCMHSVERRCTEQSDECMIGFWRSSVFDDLEMRQLNVFLQNGSPTLKGFREEFKI